MISCVSNIIAIDAIDSPKNVKHYYDLKDDISESEV